MICLTFTGWTGLLFLSMAAEHEMIILYGGFYSSLLFCSLIYLAGIRSTISKGKRPDHKMKTFYFYPLFLHLISNVIYSYLGITLVKKAIAPAGQGFYLTMMFFVSLGSYIMFYIAGMIITNRHIHNKEMYFNKDLFMLSMSYIGPAIPLSIVITYLVKDSVPGIFISLLVAFIIGVLFCYLGIILASGGNQTKPGKYRFFILSVYLAYALFACVSMPLIGIPLFKGEFLPMWAGFLSTIFFFMTIYPVCLMMAGYIYKPETRPKETITTKSDDPNGDEVYFKLRDYLDKLPAGYPGSEEKVEIRLLKKLFNPEEARIAVQMRFFPEPPFMIAERCDLEKAETVPMLASMNKKGLIRELKSGQRLFYMASQYLVGILEDQIKTLDREYAEMNVHMIANYHQAGYGDSLLRQFRVVPINEAVDSTSTVASYEQIRKLIKRQKLASVMPCICRRQMGLLEIICDKPHETCLTFGFAAKMAIDKGYGRKISIEEVSGIIDQAEKASLVLMTTNAQEIINICCCCGCCCGMLQLLKAVKRPVDHIHSAFQAEIDSGLCKKCGVCLDRCQMRAIVKHDHDIEVNHDRCIGCGLCVSTCPTEAISLIAKNCTEPVPKNYMDMLTTIARNRGLGYGKLNMLMKFANLPLAIKMLPLFYMSGLGKPVVNQMAKWGWV